MIALVIIILIVMILMIIIMIMSDDYDGIDNYVDNNMSTLK